MNSDLPYPKIRKVPSLLTVSCILLTALGQVSNAQVMGTAPMPTADPYMDGDNANYLKVERISSTNPADPAYVHGVTQMAFGPDGRLYMSVTQTNFATPGSVKSYAYSATGNLDGSSLKTVAVFPAEAQILGLAFHGSTLYVSANNGTTKKGSIVRMRDENGNGVFGETGETRVAIVNNIPIGDHGVDHMVVQGNTLFVGIGNMNNTDRVNHSNDGCYSGTISFIQDLTMVPDLANAAGFSDADVAAGRPYNYVPSLGEAPAAAKLIIHSSGARNPFGINLDGDGNVWMTNNREKPRPVPDQTDCEIRNDIHDQFFKAVYKGDYGFITPWRNHSAAIAGGYFSTPVSSFTFDNLAQTLDMNSELSGLGPNSSADGFDFYKGNSFPLKYHKLAFITRFVDFNFDLTIVRTGSVTNCFKTTKANTNYYNDVVLVDLKDTAGQAGVKRLVRGFNNALDTKMDPYGNILVADFRAVNYLRARPNSHPKLPGLYRISPLNPVTGCHGFSWDVDADGSWSQSANWNTGLDPVGTPNPRVVPHQWGDAQYCVTISRGGSNPTVSLADEVAVESLTLGDTLELLDGSGLSVLDSATLNSDGTLSLPLSSSSTFSRMQVGGAANLGGTLKVTLEGGYVPTLGDTVVVMNYGSRAGEFSNVDAPALGGGLSWNVHYGEHEVLLVVEDHTAPAITAYADPSEIMPANGSFVPVTITGCISDDGSGIDMDSATFNVVDEYGQVQPSGHLVVGPDGCYAVTILVHAKRNGNDKDGREYIVNVNAADLTGNVGTASVVVRVLHDQGN